MKAKVKSKALTFTPAQSEFTWAYEAGGRFFYNKLFLFCALSRGTEESSSGLFLGGLTEVCAVTSLLCASYLERFQVQGGSFDSHPLQPSPLLQSGSMPAVFLLLRTLVIRLFSSRLAGSVAQFLGRALSSGAAHLSTALRYVWDRLRSQECKEAVLGCVLCILNMHKKVES
ncbi:hypothetical protein WMY93_018979 [Mugilogobius chulae]|uniref:Uncharacterized protein n=1 Tax=Mugilogobius chulae TaxID=88201 RepID=A0AAW0NKA9_9GOBI